MSEKIIAYLCLATAAILIGANLWHLFRGPRVDVQIEDEEDL